MKYFIDTAVSGNTLSKIWAFEDDVIFPLELPNIPSTLVEITEEQYKAEVAKLAPAPLTENAILAPVYTNEATPPNTAAFLVDLKTTLGSIIEINALAVTYPLLLPLIQQGAWLDVQALFIDAVSKGVINASQATVIDVSAANNHIPIIISNP